MNTATETAVQVGTQMLPALLASAAAADPKVAIAAPVIIDLMRAAVTVGQAAGMSREQLQSVFADIGKGIEATHEQWAAMTTKG